MLRRKLALTEDAARASRHLQEERDDLIAKYKRQCRMVERLNGEVSDARLQMRDLKAQLTDAADEKSRGTQQQKKIEELTAKVNELDNIRSRQQKKITHLKEQVKAHGEQMLEERRINESNLDGITQDMALTKQAVRDLTRREKQLTEFRRAVVELMGMDGEPGVEGDYETICRLERIVGAHRELTDLSRRLDELTGPSRPNSARTLTSRSPPLRSPSRQCPMAATYKTDTSPRLVLDQGYLDMSEELRALADDAHNHRPHARAARRPPSAAHSPPPTHCRPPSTHSRTPSPAKHPSTDEEDYS
ncbi:coiled-coil domain-containing protein 170 [Cherax quadricarinatus]|uniref:coiled-coil domain-containing protein 170 n=1 Tax=Cherax quadricarinatus TaxID=27406 RepID=UPI00387E8DDF